MVYTEAKLTLQIIIQDVNYFLKLKIIFMDTLNYEESGFMITHIMTILIFYCLDKLVLLMEVLA